MKDDECNRMGYKIDNIQREVGSCAQNSVMLLIREDIKFLRKTQEEHGLNQKQIIERLNEGTKEMLKIRGLVKERELVNGQRKKEVEKLDEGYQDVISELKDEIRFMQRTVIFGVALIIATEIIRGFF